VLGKTVSLIPSIGNWSFACKSHYWISNNKVLWASKLSARQIDQVKARDKADKKAYIVAINKQKERQVKPISFVARVWQAFKHWWKS
jgi:hypothetical protein